MNERIERIELARRKKMMQRMLLIVFMAVILGGAIIGGVLYSNRRNASLPGTYYASVGAEHIPLRGEPKTPYASNPPSSGSHYSYAAKWGVYDYEVHDQIFLHNLEHGGVWIAYRPDIGAAAIAQLSDIVGSYGASKWIMSPRAANDADIAIVAWTRVLKLNPEGETLSDSQLQEIDRFYKAFKNKGPEYVPDTAPGIDPKTVQ